MVDEFFSLAPLWHYRKGQLFHKTQLKTSIRWLYSLMGI